MRHAGQLVSQRQLLQDVWGPGYGDESNYLRVHMAHLRRKLEPDRSHPRYFVTEPGMGYRFISPTDDEPATSLRCGRDEHLRPRRRPASTHRR